MQRYTLRIGQRLAVDQYVIHIVRVGAPDKIDLVVAPLGESYVIHNRRRRRRRRRRRDPSEPARQPVINAPYHSDLTAMLKT